MEKERALRKANPEGNLLHQSHPCQDGGSIQKLLTEISLFLPQKGQAHQQEKETQTKDEFFATVDLSQEKTEKSASSPQTHWLSLLATVSEAHPPSLPLSCRVSTVRTHQ